MASNNYEPRPGVGPDESAMPEISKTWVPTGGELRVIRETLGLTRPDVQELTGIKPRTLSNWEHERSHPRSNDLRLLLAVYRIKAGDGEDTD